MYIKISVSDFFSWIKRTILYFLWRFFSFFVTVQETNQVLRVGRGAIYELFNNDVKNDMFKGLFSNNFEVDTFQLSKTQKAKNVKSKENLEF
jgi:hypothetical protein